MQAFITGAAGFMGYALATRFKSEMRVLGTLRWIEQAATIDGTDWSTVVHDWEQPYQPLPTLSADVFVHAAFQGPVSDLLARNELMAVNAVDAARRLSAKRVVLLSSASVYAESDGPVDESTAVASVDRADASSLSLQRIERTFIDAFSDVPLTIVRLFNPYGPNQPKDRIVPRLATLIEMGLPIPIPRNTFGGSGGALLNPCFIGDVAETIFRLSTSSAQGPGPMIVNIGGVEKVSIRDLALKIGAVLGKECLFSEDQESSPVGNVICDTGLSRRLSGFTPAVPLSEGLRRTLFDPVAT